MDTYLQPIQDHLTTILLAINDYLTQPGCLVLATILVLILISLKLQHAPAKKTVHQAPILHDVDAIAGDDLATTQLDLARAYIEMDKRAAAKQILEQVIKTGDAANVRKAKQLLTSL